MMKTLAAAFLALGLAALFLAAGPVQPACLPFKLITAANTNPTLIASGHRQISQVVATSNNTAFFLKFYDLARAPNVGTDVPVQTYGVAASVSGSTAVGQMSNFPMDFLSGLAFGTTANVGDADTGNIAANAVINICWL
jgi:hypothetical protein